MTTETLQPAVEQAPPAITDAQIRRSKAKKIISKVVIYAILVLYAIIILFPFFIVFITSLKTAFDASKSQFEWIPSEGYTFAAYGAVLTYLPPMIEGIPLIIRGFLNTLLYILPPTLIGLTTSSISAYAFAKLRFRAKKWMYAVLLATMMIPGTIMIVPQYTIYDMIYWTETPLPLMIPGMFGAAACVFFMRQFYAGIPDSIIEAAKLDGLGFLGIFFWIMVPLSVPALLAQGLLGFIGGYNDYLGPLLYLRSDPGIFSLQIALRYIVDKRGIDEPNLSMAASIVALLPTLIIYFICQKFFIEGIVTSGLKQ